MKERAKAILDSIEDFPADVVTLQEVCRTTYNEIRDNLGPGWTTCFMNNRITRLDAVTLDHTGALRSSPREQHSRPSFPFQFSEQIPTESNGPSFAEIPRSRLASESVPPILPRMTPRMLRSSA